MQSYNRWSSESRSQTCLDYAESRQRKTIVNRFVELEKEVAIPLALFIKKVLLGKCTGISFVDSTPLNINVTYNRGEDLSQASYLPDKKKGESFGGLPFICYLCNTIINIRL